MGEQLLSHWDVVLTVGLIIMAYARSDAGLEATKLRVSDLEKKVEKQDSALNKVQQDVAEIKGLTKAIYDQVTGKN